jgi:hypothetical protein
MKIQKWFLAALGSLLLLTGCPYESKVPLTKPHPGSLDPRLFGTWVGTAGAEADSNSVLVVPFSDTEYLVELKEKNGTVDRYRAVGLEIGGQPFLQINEVSEEIPAKSFVLARYTLAPGGRLTVRLVGEKIVPKDLAADAKGLLGFVAAHLNDPQLDDEDTLLQLLSTDSGRASPAKGGTVGGEGGAGK